jgi:hypothetical protein
LVRKKWCRMSEEEKRRKVTRAFEKKWRSMVAARRRAEGKSRRDVSVEEGSCNGGACTRSSLAFHPRKSPRTR